MISGMQWVSIQMLEIVPTTRFKSDLKKFKHNKKVIQVLNDLLKLLVCHEPLPRSHVDHTLEGNWKGSRECHIRPDVLLIYRLDSKQNKIFLERIGSHSELF